MDPFTMYLLLNKDSKAPDKATDMTAAPGLDMKKLMALSMMQGMGGQGSPANRSNAPMGSNPIGDALGDIQNQMMQRKLLEAITGQRMNTPMDWVGEKLGIGNSLGAGSSSGGKGGATNTLSGGNSGGFFDSTAGWL